MLNLKEYNAQPDTLADYLPWGFLVAPGVVLNKDGGLMRTVRYRGPDLESATPAEMVASCARINNVLRRFGDDWALFFEAERRAVAAYPESQFPDPVSWLVDRERAASFSADAGHFESRYFLSFLWLPPEDRDNKAERLFLERATPDGTTPDAPADIPTETSAETSPNASTQFAPGLESGLTPEPVSGLAPGPILEHFLERTGRAIDLLAGEMVETTPLGDAELLAYLHGTVSTSVHPIAPPSVPAHLDALLADRPLAGGLEPMLGEEHIRVLGLLGFPDATTPGILDDLNRLGIGYRWMTRFVPLGRSRAEAALRRTRRQWFAKRKSMGAMVKEVAFNETAALTDASADDKVADSDAALRALGSDLVSFGHATVSVVVRDRDRRVAGEKAAAIERAINARGFTVVRESLNAVDTWLASLPGHAYANPRRPVVHTLNLTHMMPVSAVWAGAARSPHLDGPALLHADTSGATPFRLNLHSGDVGHTMVVGPTGSGKSVLLSLLALQWRRYAGSQVFIFDKGGSARAACLGMGGVWIELGDEDAKEDGAPSAAFQPLRGIDREQGRSFALDWLAGLAEREGVPATPDMKAALWSALNSLAGAAPEERTLTGLSVLLQSRPLREALAPYTLDGPHGRLLDAEEDRLVLSDVQCFEMEELMHRPALVAPIVTYLFHRLEERFDGRPTLLVLDEAWVFLDDPVFAGQLREWLKVLRKRNVAVLFATQSLTDIAGSTVAPAVIESCPTRIFLPNERAGEPQQREIYTRFGLNAQQIAAIATAVPRREYYLQSPQGCRLFDLNIGPVASAFCAGAGPERQRAIDAILARPRGTNGTGDTGGGPNGAGEFAAAWLEAAGLDWASELLAMHSGTPATPARPDRHPQPQTSS